MQPLAVTALMLFAHAAGQPSARAGARSECAVASDAAYAFTREQAVQVGGGAMYVAARERRYLDALRGPTGQVVRYRRTGSLPAGSDARTILDRYELTYDGLDTPLVIYLDGYHYDDEVRAPQGLICAVPIGLNPPPPDTFLAMSELMALAIEQGSTRNFEPIPLDADGSGTHGFVLDHFRVIARAARHAALAGQPLDPAAHDRELSRTKAIVVAFPIQCGGRAIGPVGVELVGGPQAAPLRRDGEIVSGEAFGRLVPGLNAPPGTIGATYLLDKPRGNDSVRIVYPDGTCGDITLPLRITPARPIRTPPGRLPQDHPATERTVRLQALIDVDGAAQRIVYLGGPAGLAQAAVDTVRGWTAEPARINGAPVVTPVMLQVKFERR